MKSSFIFFFPSFVAALLWNELRGFFVISIKCDLPPSLSFSTFIFIFSLPLSFIADITDWSINIYMYIHSTWDTPALAKSYYISLSDFNPLPYNFFRMHNTVRNSPVTRTHAASIEILSVLSLSLLLLIIRFCRFFKLSFLTTVLLFLNEEKNSIIIWKNHGND